eukprot:3673361-Amphidinium_carterae.1
MTQCKSVTCKLLVSQTLLKNLQKQRKLECALRVSFHYRDTRRSASTWTPKPATSVELAWLLGTSWSPCDLQGHMPFYWVAGIVQNCVERAGPLRIRGGISLSQASRSSDCCNRAAHCSYLPVVLAVEEEDQLVTPRTACIHMWTFSRAVLCSSAFGSRLRSHAIAAMVGPVSCVNEVTNGWHARPDGGNVLD